MTIQYSFKLVHDKYTVTNIDFAYPSAAFSLDNALPDKTINADGTIKLGDQLAKENEQVRSNMIRAATGLHNQASSSNDESIKQALYLAYQEQRKSDNAWLVAHGQNPY